MLPVTFSPFNDQYNPAVEILQGLQLESHDSPARVNSIRKHLLTREDVKWYEVSEECPIELLSQVHTPAYLSFLQNISKNLSKDQFIIPDTFPVRYFPLQLPSDIKLQAGYFCFDTFSPFTAYTYRAASLAATCAIEGAKLLHSKPVVYSLTRPPGHHSQSDLAGGFCFLNNAAIAAEFLRQTYSHRVAILDIDYHHGNGTQEIFYKSNEVFFVSLHGDPSFCFPYFSGYSDEIGKGKGKGYNLNLPLPKGTSEEQYLKVIDKAIKKINKFNPEALVVSVGFDTYFKDPIGTFHLSEESYTQIASKIQKLEIPLLLIQEGGYNVKHLGNLASSFLNGFL